MTFQTFPHRPSILAPRRTVTLIPALAMVLALGAPGALMAQDLSQLPQQSVMDAPGSRAVRPVTRSTTPLPAPSYAAPLPMVSNPVVQPLPTPRAAQAEVPSVSRPVVQAVPSNNGQTLNAALDRLARDPRNVDALLDAGNAAMALGDVDAALGFLRRADEVAPGNGRVKTQIGKALLRHNDPVAAIRAFDDAERAGADPVGMSADRGLAHDLVGDNAMAQRYYRQGLARAPDAEVTRRLALSLAIGGDRVGAESVLAPQIAQSDRAAWRVRTFILAIAGQPDEAVAVANSSMPPQLAAGIAPYLRYLTRLTPAQQAAAANFGRFPRAADIGQDDPQIVQYAQTHPRAAPVALAQAAPLPAASTASNRRDRHSRNGRAAPLPPPVSSTPVPPTPVPPTPSTVTTRPPVQMAQNAPSNAGPVADMIPRPVSAPPTATPPIAAPLAATPVPPTPVAKPAPAIVLPPAPPAQVAMAAATPMPTPTPAAAASQQPTVQQPTAQQPTARPPMQIVAQPVVQPLPPAPSPDGFAALFAGFAAPAEEQQRPTVAVDLAAIQAANERAAAAKAAVEARKAAEAKKLADAKKAAADKKAAAEKKLADAKKAEEDRKAKEEAKRLAASPARTWVQVLTGGNHAKMGKEWAGLQSTAPELRGRKAFVTPWNRVYRLVTGPFPSNAAAQEFVAKLKQRGVSAFQFDSPAGQAMESVSAK